MVTASHRDGCSCIECSGEVRDPASKADLRQSYETVLNALHDLVREAGRTAKRDTTLGHDAALSRATSLLKAAGRLR